MLHIQNTTKHIDGIRDTGRRLTSNISASFFVSFSSTYFIFNFKYSVSCAQWIHFSLLFHTFHTLKNKTIYMYAIRFPFGVLIYQKNNENELVFAYTLIHMRIKFADAIKIRGLSVQFALSSAELHFMHWNLNANGEWKWRRGLEIRHNGQSLRVALSTALNFSRCWKTRTLYYSLVSYRLKLFLDSWNFSLFRRKK